MRIIFFGSSKFVIPIIQTLQKNFDLVLVVTTEKPKPNLALQGDAPSGASQGEALSSYPVIDYCIKHEIPYLSVQQFNNSTIQQLKESNALVAVLASFGLIIPGSVLDAFPKGIINIHPSLLPKYRGPTPVQTAILNGEKTTGITIIKLDEEIDHGPILSQEKEEIFPSDTSESLYQRLFKIASSSIVQTIELYLKGNLNLRKQNHSKATFTNRLTRTDGYIDLSSLKIESIRQAQDKNLKLKINRMIRAYHPWPGAWTKIRIKNHESRIKFLPDKKIQVEGKKPMSYKNFLNGYPSLPPVMLNLFQHLSP